MDNDKLIKYVSNELVNEKDIEIERVLNDNTLDIEEKVDKLILKSNLRGGNDNISIAYLSREGVV